MIMPKKKTIGVKEMDKIFFYYVIVKYFFDSIIYKEARL